MTPIPLSGEVGSVSASTIAVTWNQAIAATDYSAGCSVSVNGGPVAISSATRQSGNLVVYYVLASPVYSGDTVTFSYDDCAGTYYSTATNIVFPVCLDNLTNPTPADKLGTPAVLHSDQHANANDAIEALERKVGINGSTDTNSLDYQISHITSGSTAPFQTNSPANVGASAVIGTSGSVPHADHVHAGVHGVFTEPNSVLTGNIALVGGTNISVTQSSGSLTINNTMAAGGVVFDTASPFDIGSLASVGTSGSPPHADHVHRGIRSIFVEPNSGQFGDIALVGQNGMTITQSSGSFSFNQDLTGYVQTSRTISTTAPLAGGGDLSSNLTLSISQASHTTDGFLSAADWTIFNDKQSNLTPFQTDYPIDIGSSASIGSSGSVPHSDHVHRGVAGLFTSPNDAIFGTISLSGTGDITVAQSSGSFVISATSGSFLPQVHDINGAYHTGFPLLVSSGGLGTTVTPTSGAIPIGNASGIYVPNHIAAGDYISVTNSSGSIAISATSNFSTSFLLMGG